MTTQPEHGGARWHGADSGSDFAELVRRVKAAGLLERRPRYYLVKISATAATFFAAWAAFVMLGDSWWQIAVAVVLAIVFTQIGFIGHEAGHRPGLRRLP